MTQPNPVPPDTLDAFASLDTWLTQPHLAYATLLSSRPLSPATRRVYLSMWEKFSDWLADQNVPLPSCQAHHIALFLDSHALKKEHRYRYVRLIERVFRHLNSLDLCSHNPGSRAAIDRVGAGQNDPTRFLTDAERVSICAYLRGIYESAGEVGGGAKKREEKRREVEGGEGKAGPATVDWSVLRDAAMVGVMLGGGLKVGELLRMAVNCTLTIDGLEVPALGKVRKHTARLFPIAREALEAWLPVRAELVGLGETLFPAVAVRRRHDQIVSSPSMHPATVYRRVTAVLEAAGVTGGRACCQTLRNTYAGCLIDAGAEDLELTECLGLFVDTSASRLRAAYEVVRT